MLDLATKHETQYTNFSHTAVSSHSGPATHSSSMKSSFFFPLKNNLFSTVETLSN